MNPTPQINTAADIHNALVSMGGTTNDAGRYSQEENIRRHTNRTVMDQMGAGYCEGVTLDWIRRALLPRVLNSNGSVPWERLNFAVDKPQRDLRHADAQNKISDPHTQAQYKASIHDAYVQRFNVADDRSEVVAAHSQWNNSPTLQKIWWGFSHAADRRLREDRETSGKQGGPSRGFSRLHIIAAQNARDFSGGVFEFVTRVLTLPEFQTNRAAQVAVAPPGGAGGHAVAILRNNASVFVFFEPNFGTYVFTDRRKLRDAVVFLFRDGYPRIAGQGHDAHAYQVNGHVSGRYTIFEGRETPVPGPQQILFPT